jgi:peptidoglycan/xylan/chitin deacetylase (PgdA/CDA1 family)
MTNTLDAALASNRATTDELIALGERVASKWTTPRAPGKWSPAQVTEHVARSFEEAANMIGGRPTKLPTIPALFRPLGGWMFRRILRTGNFPKVKTSRAMNPEMTPTAPANPAEGRARLQSALTTLERECRAHAGRPFTHTAFGEMTVEDYVRFTELHTRHHMKQIPS